jgi:hypothetical protein
MDNFTSFLANNKGVFTTKQYSKTRVGQGPTNRHAIPIGQQSSVNAAAKAKVDLIEQRLLYLPHQWLMNS